MNTIGDIARASHQQARRLDRRVIKPRPIHAAIDMTAPNPLPKVRRPITKKKSLEQLALEEAIKLIGQETIVVYSKNDYVFVTNLLKERQLLKDMRRWKFKVDDFDRSEVNLDKFNSISFQLHLHHNFRIN